MGRTKLTRPEISALLITIRDELKLLFEELELDSSAEFKKKASTVVGNLGYIIKEKLKADPDDKNIYEIFNK